MLRRPDVDEVMEYGRALGFDLTPMEARMIQARMMDTIASLEAFDEMRVEERRPPLRFTDRDPGRRPSAAEDPLGAFITRCRVPGAASGPLHGKTVALKDHIALAGVAMTFSSHMMDGYVPDFDATVVTRLLDAGATIVGKLKMEEFSWGGPGCPGWGTTAGRSTRTGTNTSPAARRRARAPRWRAGWSTSRWAATRAARSGCPPRGAASSGSCRPTAWSRTRACSGSSPPSTTWGRWRARWRTSRCRSRSWPGATASIPRQADVPATVPPYPAALARGVKGLRVGLLDEGFGVAGGDPAVDEAVMEAVRTLERAGARVERVSVPLHTQALPALLPIYLEGGKRMYDTHFGGTGAKTHYPSSLISIFGRLKQSHAREFSPNLKLNLLQGYYLQRNYGGRLYAKAQNVRPTFVAQYDRVFAGVDVLAMPTIPMTAPRWQEPRDHEDAMELTMLGGKRSLDLGPVIANTCPFNYTGHPAISVPCAKIGGLPVGLMLVAPYFREDTLIQAAAAYQRSVDWAALIATAAPPA